MFQRLTQLVARDRREARFVTILLIVIIAAGDVMIGPEVSLDLLYLLPILVTAVFQNRWTLVGDSLLCAAIAETINPQRWTGVWPLRVANLLAAYLGIGLFVSELVRRRRDASSYAQQLSAQVTQLKEAADQREFAQRQLNSLLLGSPAAILTVDAAGNIALANEAAQDLLRRDEKPIVGQPIAHYLPALAELRLTSQVRSVRTMVECTGVRQGGETFLAHAWVSSDGPPSESGLSAVLFDSSEDLRHNEEARLHTLTVGARIASGAFWHEARNLSSALRVVIGSLKRVPKVAETEEMSALEALVGGLEQLASDELHPSPTRSYDIASLRVAIEHLRVVMDPTLREYGITARWRVDDSVPMVHAEAHGLLQVFVNVVRNACRAMENAEDRRLDVRAVVENNMVAIRFQNTGQSVADPRLLFQPFQVGSQGLGVGLYVSRAILRSFGGDIRYESVADGSCFVITLKFGDLDG